MKWPQICLISVFAFATGWVMGISKFIQVLMTGPHGNFKTTSEAKAIAFLLTYGIAKALGNQWVGAAADHYGRKPCMVIGWVFGVLFCLASTFAPTWELVVISYLLLGLNQAFCWSVAIFMGIDWLGPTRRATAVGLAEFLGYVAIASASPVIGAVGLDGIVVQEVSLIILTICCAIASQTILRETRVLALDEASASQRAQKEIRSESSSSSLKTSADRAVVTWPSGHIDEHKTVRMVFAHVSCLDSALMSCCLVGLALNFATAYAWVIMSRWLLWILSDHTSSTIGVGMVQLAYSMPKGLVQLPAGLLADLRPFGCGPREFVLLGLACIVASLLGMTMLAIFIVDGSSAALYTFPLALLLGTGTAIAYTPVIACVANRSDPSWRSTAVGAYRFWRDLGYLVGGLVIGLAIDLANGLAWVGPLLAAVFVAVTTAVFGWCYPRGGADKRPMSDVETCSSEHAAEPSAPAELLSRDAPRSA